MNGFNHSPLVPKSNVEPGILICNNLTCQGDILLMDSQTHIDSALICPGWIVRVVLTYAQTLSQVASSQAARTRIAVNIVHLPSRTPTGFQATP